MQKTYNKKRQLGALNFTIYMIVGVVLLVIMSAASISFGAADMNLTTAWGAIFNFDSSLTEHQIIQTLRLPRIAANIIVGSSLAICGAIMQGTTRNPLADSGLMGISSGATFAMAFCMAFLPGGSYGQMMLFACIGAAITTGMTYFIASIGRGGMKPQRLVLAGISISMLFGAFSQYLSIKYKLGHALAYWTAGGTAGAKWSELAIVFPFFIVGIIVAFVISPSITVLNLGDDAAIGLGLNTKKVKGVSTVVVLILTGISVIVVGPVGFVGLIVPHIVRYLIGVDYRYIIPASGLYGALITVTADLVGRLINKPYETPIGIIFALIGVPYFLYLTRIQRREFE
ncbi:FecCD family ABC transporter permease [Clostridium botulinum]|uniref:Ferrichrome transport system permease protein n=1 Tax=Clostridium botulinum (strain Hall / ATCC 3502 / NCTC 13319 / Type A) TaxID=441771 RepID=A5HYK4_CLOBH|nr:iron ABC transporter permease [Clostridium botulinum]EPS46414.1 iron ABC transporter permease [Clostridium botulinum CFSAN002367]KEI82557.1 ferrichrome ABC transporter permease [Clostridium botulinum B2 128]KON08188.1 ferrichrome ABC transporter permease [Clostridium botulinum]MBY6906763.1 iron ABC transporter permease [Clostridium botulinum]MBY6928277.1 iron ABC transporter permease [Clostridium botulinum]